MKMIDVVLALRSQGHEVDFYIRNDGGILVRRIDGEKFSGAKGNAKARQLTGVTLSEARTKQLKYATRTRARKKLLTIDDEIEKEYKRVKKKWDKVFKAKGGKPHPAGYFGRSRIEYAIKTYGKDEALRRIREAEKYTSGIAYSKNVEHLADFIDDYARKTGSEELSKLADDLRENAYSIQDEWIEPAYQELYKLNQGKDSKEVAKNVRTILRL